MMPDVEKHRLDLGASGGVARRHFRGMRHESCIGALPGGGTDYLDFQIHLVWLATASNQQDAVAAVQCIQKL